MSVVSSLKGCIALEVSRERESIAMETSHGIVRGTILRLLFAVFSVSLASCHKTAMRVSDSATSRLKKPVVILLSSDGFRWGYQWKVPTPNIDRLTKNGVEAFPGMFPVFPSVTFSNHYSIATGLYPAWHGIISNSFRDPTDTSRLKFFKKSDTDPKWWLGEPIWETVVNHGLEAATFFWPGSEVVKGKWTCPPAYCHRYNKSVSFSVRVDTVLDWLDLPESKRPSFISVYLHSPDSEAHLVGPDSPEISDAIATVDAALGRLLDGLQQRKILDDVNVIMTSDHGFVGTCDTKLISVEELSAVTKINIPEDWIESVTPVLAIRPPPATTNLRSMVAALNSGLASGRVDNGKFLKLFVKEDLPSRLHYSASDRIQPIVGLVSEGYKVVLKRLSKPDCGGAHGYDNLLGSMRAVFFARGPSFPRGKQVEPFVNVEVYNMVTKILGLKGAANNGTKGLAKKILL